MIYAYGVTIVGVTLTFSIYDSSFNLVSSPAIPPGAKLRVITSPDGVVFTEQALPISEAAGIVTITPAVPPVSGDLLIILPWNEGLRGSRGEWVSAAILDVP